GPSPRQHVQPGSDDETANIKRATIRQVLEHQLHNVRACDRVLDQERTLPIGDPDGVTVTEPAEPGQAMAFLDEEYEAIQRGIRLATDQRLEGYEWLLSMALVTYQWHRHLLHDALTNLKDAADAAESIATPVDRAMVQRMLAGTRWRLGQYDLTVGYLRRAVLLSEEDRSAAGRLSLARSLHRLGITLRKQGDRTSAEEALCQALELCKAVADPVGEAAALNALGTLHLDRGEHDQALLRCTDALGVLGCTAERSGLADVLFTLAKVHVACSERDEAVSLYRRACDIYREQENWPSEHKTRRLFADVLVSVGKTEEAIRELERVIVLRELMGLEGVPEVRDLLEGLR
uniref:tetratricopeptide repeat protein n=1 Tax=Nocardiopsis chromatogenes TaxID=280239 RepID=UPI00195546D9